jgi:hypothetical protein
MAKKRKNVYELKTLENPIIRKRAVKKYKRRKNAKDSDNPDYYDKKHGGTIVKKPMGGKVYKVDNAGQMMVQRMYGGKLGF